ncbi:hypothetical protein BN1708_020142, partial [Verticillium longisporum]
LLGPQRLGHARGRQR